MKTRTRSVREALVLRHVFPLVGSEAQAHPFSSSPAPSPAGREGLCVQRVIWAWMIAALVAAGMSPGCSKKEAPAQTAKDDAQEARRIPVRLTAASLREFTEEILTQGNVEAKNTAMISPRIPGVIETIYVDEGDSVVAEETRLFQTDSEKLERAVEIATQALAVAKCAVQEKEANKERVAAEFEKAETDYQRFERLFALGAVTKDDYENQLSRYKQTSAMKKHADTLVTLSQEQMRQAEAGLAIAKKDLSDSLVLAPLSGRVSQRLKEPGELGNPGSPVLRIDDTSALEVSAFLPAELFDRIVPGETAMAVKVHGSNLLEVPVSYKSPTIQPKLRTFEVKALLSDPQAGVAPGAMAEIRITLSKRQALGIPMSAVQRRGDHDVVFTVQADRARQVEVRTGLKTDGWIEVEGVSQGSSVVTEGQHLIQDNSPVQVQEGA